MAACMAILWGTAQLQPSAVTFFALPSSCLTSSRTGLVPPHLVHMEPNFPFQSCAHLRFAVMLVIVMPPLVKVTNKGLQDEKNKNTD